MFAILISLLFPAGNFDDSPAVYVRKKLPAVVHYLKQTRPDAFQDSTGSPADDLFAWHEITRRTFDNNHVNLNTAWRNRFIAALRTRVLMDLRSWLLEQDTTLRAEKIRIDNERITGNKAQLTLRIMREGEFRACTLRLILENAAWRIYDIRTDEWRLVRDRLRPFDELISNGYNFEYVEAILLNKDDCQIDDFSSINPGNFPKGWGWTKKDDNRARSEKIYQIDGDDANTYLVSTARDVDISLIKPFSYNLADFPTLCWRWRAKSFPSNKTDYAASVTVIFYQNWLGIPLSITYVWAPGNTSCSIVRREGWLYDTYAIVLRNESDPLDEWLDEAVRPAEDFARIFGTPPPEQTVGIYLLTSSTGRETVISHYDDLRATRTRLKTSCGK